MTQFPLNTLHFHLTRNCNLSCEHCWISSRPNIEKTFLDSGTIYKQIIEAISLGAETIKLSGGEPLIYPNFSDIFEFALSHGLKTKIETNGLTELNYLKPLLLKYNSLIDFSFSIDAHNEILSKIIRKNENIFKRTIGNIKLLKSCGCNVSATSLVTIDNISCLNDIIDLCLGIGINNHRLILNLNPSGSARRMLRKSLSIQETLKLVENISKLSHYDESQIKDPCLYTTLPPAFQKSAQYHFNTCNWGINLCSILSNLKVAICGGGYNSDGFVAGDLLKSSLTEIWNNSPLFKKIRYSCDLKGVCSICKFKLNCRGLCRAQAFAVYHDLFAPYPFCQDAYQNNLFPEINIIKSN